MNKFQFWLAEREDTKFDTKTNMIKTHLGLQVLRDSSFLNLQVSDFDSYEDFRRKMTEWNAFGEMSDISKSAVQNMIKNQNSRMRDIVIAMNKD